MLKYIIPVLMVSVLNSGVFDEKLVKFFKATENAVNETTRRVVTTFDDHEDMPDAFPKKLIQEQEQRKKLEKSHRQQLAQKKAKEKRLARVRKEKALRIKKEKARKLALMKLKKVKIKKPNKPKNKQQKLAKAKKRKRQSQKMTLAQKRSMEVKIMFGVPVTRTPLPSKKEPKRYVIVINDRTLKEEEKPKIKKHRRTKPKKTSKNKYIIKIAKSYLNKPYVYGASSKTTRCFDCSSFVQRVYKKVKPLPRTSKSQAYVGKHVSKKNIKTGDLVFFSSKKTKGVAHVGIAISKDKFIHASSGAGRVIISSLNRSYYRHHYKGARRIV